MFKFTFIAVNAITGLIIETNSFRDANSFGNGFGTMGGRGRRGGCDAGFSLHALNFIFFVALRVLVVSFFFSLFDYGFLQISFVSISVVVVLESNGVVVDVGVADFAVGFGGLRSEFLAVSGLGHCVGLVELWFYLDFIL